MTPGREITDPPLGNRIRAAIAYAGLNGFEALAERIDQPGLGTKTLRNIADGTRAARRPDLIVIAEATGLPYEFFVLPRHQLVEGFTGIADTRLMAMDDRLAGLERGMVLLTDAMRRAGPEGVEGAFAELAEELGRLQSEARPPVAEGTPPERAQGRRRAS